MRDYEDATNGMPINRDYDPHVTNEVFFPDKELANDAQEDPYDVDGATEKNSESKDATDRGLSSTGAYDEYTATLEGTVTHKKNFFQDHGDKVVDMNVDGMPWFHDELEERELQMRRNTPELNRRETRRVIFSSLLAAFMIAGIFVLALFLFLLFCTKVWF